MFITYEENKDTLKIDNIIETGRKSIKISARIIVCEQYMNVLR